MKKLYLEGITPTQEEFYERLKQDEPISTSQPNPGEVCALWENLLKNTMRWYTFPCQAA